MRAKNYGLELNQARTSLPVFMESYNKSIPVNFPHVSIEILKQFQALHPSLFSARGGSAFGGKNDDKWSIDRHRKRVMDWLPSQSPVFRKLVRKK